MWRRFKLLRSDNKALEERQIAVEEGWMAMLKRFMLLDWVSYVSVCGAVVLFGGTEGQHRASQAPASL